MIDFEDIASMAFAKPVHINTDTEPFIEILAKEFPRGYRLGSSLEMKKFRRHYELINGVALDMEQEKAEFIIRKCGIVHDGRVYMPQTMLSDELKEKLFSFIDKSIAEGKTAIYFEALFREFSDEFLDHNMYDSDMLKTCIAHFAGGKYYIEKSYLSKERRVVVEPIEDVRICLKERGIPIPVEELCQMFCQFCKGKAKLYNDGTSFIC